MQKLLWLIIIFYICSLLLSPVCAGSEDRRGKDEDQGAPTPKRPRRETFDPFSDGSSFNPFPDEGPFNPFPDEPAFNPFPDDPTFNTDTIADPASQSSLFSDSTGFPYTSTMQLAPPTGAESSVPLAETEEPDIIPLSDLPPIPEEFFSETTSAWNSQTQPEISQSLHSSSIRAPGTEGISLSSHSGPRSPSQRSSRRNREVKGTGIQTQMAAGSTPLSLPGEPSRTYLNRPIGQNIPYLLSSLPSTFDNLYGQDSFLNPRLSSFSSVSPLYPGLPRIPLPPSSPSLYGVSPFVPPQTGFPTLPLRPSLSQLATMIERERDRKIVSSYGQVPGTGFSSLSSHRGIPLPTTATLSSPMTDTENRERKSIFSPTEPRETETGAPISTHDTTKIPYNSDLDMENWGSEEPSHDEESNQDDEDVGSENKVKRAAPAFIQGEEERTKSVEELLKDLGEANCESYLKFKKTYIERLSKTQITNRLSLGNYGKDEDIISMNRRKAALRESKESKLSAMFSLSSTTSSSLPSTLSSMSSSSASSSSTSSSSSRSMTALIRPGEYDYFQMKTSEANYQFIRPLEIDSTDSIFLAKNRITNELVVVKFPYVYYKSNIPFTAWMSKELSGYVKIGPHPYILKLRGFFDDTAVSSGIYHTPAIVMEYCSGGDLANFIAELEAKEVSASPSPHTLETLKPVAKYMKQILIAVKRLHDLKLVHGDLRPENILIDSHDNIKLADFECMIDKELSGESHQVPVQVNYLAPEYTVSGMSFSSDIYAIGLIFYELIMASDAISTAIVEKLDTQRSYLLEHFYISKNHLRPGSVLPTKLNELLKKLRDFPKAFDLILNLLMISESERFDADRALGHEFFRILEESTSIIDLSHQKYILLQMDK